METIGKNQKSLAALIPKKERSDVAPPFTLKASNCEKIILDEVEKYIPDDKQVRKIFNKKAHILSKLSLKCLKNTPVFLTLKKGNLILFFHTKRLFTRRY